jgi:crooked neck
LLQVWKSFEEQRGTPDDIAKVEGMMPVQGKRRYVDQETGQLVEGTDWSPHSPLQRRGWKKKLTVAYTCPLLDYDYIFADDEREANPTSFKFLQMAHAWAASKKAGDAGSGAGSGGGGGGGGGALSRFAAALTQEEKENDSQAESDGGSMDEDVASVASSQDNS